MGTLNNPGTVLLTISDLSEMEAEVEVDETEIIHVNRGQSSTVELDAYPDTTFNGIVTEVGNNAIQSQIRLGQESVDFEVVISILDSIPGIRPGLSASADIKVAQVEHALAIPIQCLTVRRPNELTGGLDSVAVNDGDEEEIEGVFVIENNTAVFKRVTVGIAGEEYFEVRSGLEEGDQVVSGPFKVINEIRDGDLVKIKKAPDLDE
jgi:HlyD family secretion protein